MRPTTKEGRFRPHSQVPRGPFLAPSAVFILLHFLLLQMLSLLFVYLLLPYVSLPTSLFLSPLPSCFTRSLAPTHKRRTTQSLHPPPSLSPACPPESKNDAEGPRIAPARGDSGGVKPPLLPRSDFPPIGQEKERSRRECGRGHREGRRPSRCCGRVERFMARRRCEQGRSRRSSEGPRDCVC